MNPKILFWFYVILSIISVPIWFGMMIITFLSIPFVLIFESIRTQKTEIDNAICRGRPTKKKYDY